MVETGRNSLPFLLAVLISDCVAAIEKRIITIVVCRLWEVAELQVVRLGWVRWAKINKCVMGIRTVHSQIQTTCAVFLWKVTWPILRVNLKKKLNWIRRGWNEQFWDQLDYNDFSLMVVQNKRRKNLRNHWAFEDIFALKIMKVNKKFFFKELIFFIVRCLLV